MYFGYNNNWWVCKILQVYSLFVNTKYIHKKSIYQKWYNIFNWLLKLYWKKYFKKYI